MRTGSWVAGICVPKKKTPSGEGCSEAEETRPEVRVGRASNQDPLLACLLPLCLSDSLLENGWRAKGDISVFARCKRDKTPMGTNWFGFLAFRLFFVVASRDMHRSIVCRHTIRPNPDTPPGLFLLHPPHGVSSMYGVLAEYQCEHEHGYGYGYGVLKASGTLYGVPCPCPYPCSCCVLRTARYHGPEHPWHGADMAPRG